MTIKLFIMGEIESFSDKPGGAHKSLLLLVSELIKSAHNASIVFFGRENRSYKVNFNQIEIPVQEYRVNKIAFSLITPFMFSMYKAIAKESKNTDILHFYNVQLDPLAGLYKMLNKDKKVLSTLNNYHYIIPYFSFIFRDKGKLRHKYSFIQKNLLFFESIKENYSYPKILLLVPLIFPMAIFYLLNIYLSKKVKNYTALSETVKKIYELHSFENIEVVPNMYDSSFLTKKKTEKEKVVLFSGRIKKYKGAENLILAFKKSNLKAKGYILKIAGSGSRLIYLKNEYESNSIVFLSSIPYEKVKKEYARAEIFVHPGFCPEPFGRTILEAIQGGCKMLVSNIGEPPNIVKKEESIYQFDDLNSLVKKLEKLALSKEAGIVDKKILEQYSPQKIVKKYERIYEKL